MSEYNHKGRKTAMSEYNSYNKQINNNYTQNPDSKSDLTQKQRRLSLNGASYHFSLN